MYENELRALKKAGRFRERRLFDEDLIDLASNDYLGLAGDKKQFKKLFKVLDKYDAFAPKASMLVNGYHPVHRDFEEKLCSLNGFESGLVAGSGFLANMALIDALVRKNDILFMDEEYHASGMMATGLIKERVVYFKHNDSEDLRRKMAQYPGKRQIIAIEGVYSMSGEVCSREIFEIADGKGGYTGESIWLLRCLYPGLCRDHLFSGEPGQADHLLDGTFRHRYGAGTYQYRESK